MTPIEVEVLATLQAEIHSLKEENRKLRLIIETHELCHDSNLEVGEKEFFESCVKYIRKKFGKCSAVDKEEVKYTGKENTFH